jgi:hypothetical protein
MVKLPDAASVAALLDDFVWQRRKLRKDLASMHERDPLRLHLEEALDGFELVMAHSGFELLRDAYTYFEVRRAQKLSRLAEVDLYLKRERALERETIWRNAPDPDPDPEIERRRLEAARDEGRHMRERDTEARAVLAAQQAEALAQAAARRRAERERQKAFELQQLRARLKRPPQ